jgi:hypothetical protein
VSRTPAKAGPRDSPPQAIAVHEIVASAMSHRHRMGPLRMNPGRNIASSGSRPQGGAVGSIRE